MRRRMQVVAVLLGSLLLALCTGCGDACEEAWTEGIACDEVVCVSDDEELQEAAADAGDGTCIALAPGTYGEAHVAGGVSLLGAGKAEVTVGTVELAAGSKAVVRALHVAGVVKLRPGATDVRLVSLLVTGSRNGVQAESGASFTLESSELAGVPENGVLAVDASRVTIRDTLIHDGGGQGVWVQCSDGCECAAKPEVSLERVTLRGNSHLSLVMIGVKATLGDVSVLETRARSGEGFGLDSGGGVSASGCTELAAAGLTVSGAESFGMFVHGSSGSLGQPGEELGIIIDGGKVGGLYLEKIEGDLSLQNAVMTDNAVVGLSIGAGSHGIIIDGGKVANTELGTGNAYAWVNEDPAPMAPCVPATCTLAPVSKAELGDGLLWNEGATATISNLTMSGSARNAILIDGLVGAGSSIDGLQLEGTDTSKGVLQQRVGSPDSGLSAGEGVMVQQDAKAPWSFAAAPQPPDALPAEP